MFYNFDRNSRAFTLHYIFDKFLKMSVISRKEVYFEIVDPPVYFKYVKNIGRKGLTKNTTHNSFIEKPIHLRYIFIRQRHVQVIRRHMFHFIPLCKSISCATVYIQIVWMVVHGFHLSCDVFLSLTSQYILRCKYRKKYHNDILNFTLTPYVPYFWISHILFMLRRVVSFIVAVETPSSLTSGLKV